MALSSFKAGDECMALYWDEKLYPAIIVEISEEDGTAMVNFPKLDDDKLVNINEVYPRPNDSELEAKKKKKKKRKVDDIPGMEGMEDFNTEALKNLLNSWYMAGYYTGFYRGASEDSEEAAGHSFNRMDASIPGDDCGPRSSRDSGMFGRDGHPSHRNGRRPPPPGGLMPDPSSLLGAPPIHGMGGDMLSDALLRMGRSGVLLGNNHNHPPPRGRGRMGY